MMVPPVLIPSLEITLGNQLHPAPSQAPAPTPTLPCNTISGAGTLASSQRLFPPKV